jgi:rod shape-determining protein MreD
MSKYFWPLIAITVAAALQGNLPGWLSVMGGRPDLVLVVLVAFSLSADPELGAALGFFGGLLQGAAVGTSLGSFIVTRTITGFLAGFVNTRLFRDNPVVPTISAIWLTAVCEGLFLLANPRPQLLSALRLVLGECILNALLTLLVCLILRQFETRRKIKLADARI